MAKAARAKGWTGVLYAALSLCTALAAAPLPAEAQSFGRADKEHRLSRQLTHLCEADFDRGVDRECRALVRRGVVIIRKRLNRTGLWIGAGLDEPVLRTEMRVDFDERSYFFCGDPAADGRAPLYVSCSFNDGVNGPDCIEHLRSREELGGSPQVEQAATPIGVVAKAEPQVCREISRGLNGLLGTARAGADPFARDPG